MLRNIVLNHKHSGGFVENDCIERSSFLLKMIKFKNREQIKNGI